MCELFNHAKSQKLKFPKIELLIGQLRVRLYMATERSRIAGHIQVKSQTRYYGNVSPTGAFTAYSKTDNQVELVDALRRFGNDPIGVAAEYGKVTGNCCFCRKPVGDGKDKRSVRLGYGPVCARKWDLPWK